MIGVMEPILDPSQMARADASAVAGGISVDVLMERAGGAVARDAIAMTGSAYGSTFVVVCGKGNNAGDGFVAARKLVSAGARAVAVMVEPPESLSPAARPAFERMRGVSVVPWGSAGRSLDRATAVIDAIVGTGTKGPLRSKAAEAAEAISASGKPVLAIDIPSGVDGSTGAVGGPCVTADLTVTMAALKPGLLLHPGAARAGMVVVADIGIPKELLVASSWWVTGRDVAGLALERPPAAHKRSVGKVLVVGGSGAMPGAAQLTALGAMRAGAGLVRWALPGSMLGVSSFPEVLYSPLPETSEGTLEPAAVARIVELAEDADVVALGPGLSTHPETVEMIRKCVPAVARPMVIDADGLNALAGHTNLIATRGAPTILTPHAMELARLAGVSVHEVEANRPDVAADLATTTGAIVVSKGAPTVITDGKSSWYVTVGGPELASAGTGDVLTGVVAALLARISPEEAAWAGAYIHGSAGRVAASGADEGILASEVADAIPGALKRVREMA